MSSNAVISDERARELLASAHEAAQRAYVPYSGFPVGAALLTKGGRIVTGCNIENASYSMTICAERCAVAKAVSEGERDLLAIAVVSGKDLGPCPPCGACRQVLAEFNPDMLVILETADGEPILHTLSNLLAGAFLPAHLKAAETGGPQAGEGELA